MKQRVRVIPVVARASMLLATLWLASAGPAGAVSDARDTSVMLQAVNELMQFAAPGRSVRWQNPETGNDGQVTALQAISREGRSCWDYERSFTDRGQEMLVYGTACELEIGLWQIEQEGAPQPRPMPVPSPTGTQVAAKSESVQTSTAGAATTKPSADRVLVRQTQQLLTELGYRPGPVDGLMGRKTRAAIVDFQRDTSLSQTGEPSPVLLARLQEAKDAGIARPSPVPQPTVQPAAQPQPVAGSAPSPAPMPAPSTAPASPAPAATAPVVTSPAATAPAPSASDIVVPPAPPPPPVPQ